MIVATCLVKVLQCRVQPLDLAAVFHQSFRHSLLPGFQIFDLTCQSVNVRHLSIEKVLRAVQVWRTLESWICANR